MPGIQSEQADSVAEATLDGVEEVAKVRIARKLGTSIVILSTTDTPSKWRLWGQVKYTLSFCICSHEDLQ